MCDCCKAILGKCVKAHEPKSCPLKRGSYCTYCSGYGHSTIKCTKDTSYRRINIEFEPISEPIQKRYLDFVDEPKAIRALLKAYGELPRKEEREKDKYKKQLIKIAKKRNLVLVPHILDKEIVKPDNGLKNI